jgi:glutamate-ammonia-ligase adenylyltransferase
VDFPASRELHELLARSLEPLAQGEVAGAALAAAPDVIRQSLPRVFACSDFVSHSCSRDPRLLAALLEDGDLSRKLAPQDYAARAPAAPDGPANEADLLAQLRRWRRREMVRIAWRDLAGWADLEETLSDLSAFADAALNLAADQARGALAARHGEPRSAAGEVQPLVIVGMGKLGGGELNFSSDVDLVLLFPEHGETDGAHPIANEEFFTRQGQRLIRLLETPTVEGLVLRVDMRLRPFGHSGPLAASFAFLEDYLPRHGRDWERYAYVKARAVSAPAAYSQLDATTVQPFVYRKYLDYGMFESLREMKALIERAVARRELAEDVKLGPGGIREIELIVQLFQLIRGGQDPALRTPALLPALTRLGSSRVLPLSAVQDLEAAYRHLRRLENRLQMLADTRAHSLPQQSLTRERIALSMGASDWAALSAVHDAHRARVIEHFSAVLGRRRKAADGEQLELASLWEGEASLADVQKVLERAGIAESAEAARLLFAFCRSAPVGKLDEPGRRRLRALFPPLMLDIARQPEAVATLRRVLRVIEAIGQRSAYFALLCEQAGARRRLIELCASGDFLAQQIASHPLLLDELIDERLMVPDPGSLREELELKMQQARADPEREVEALRQVQRAAVFRVAVADLIGKLPLMLVSDRLTEIAEIIVQRAIEMAWGQITAQLGTPMCEEAGARRPVSICAVGYGKLGGREMGYASDLDLVFLHDSQGERQETSGARPIENQVFFVRLVQRLVHLLTVHDAAGSLYEVDMRLRPSGKGGLLVTSIRAFEDYQRQEAWTWEHQALLHARAVAGSARLCAELEAVRLEVLANHVRRASLREDVRGMRERMRRELSRARPGCFDMKQDAGGIADIEFLAQYWALRWAKDYPPVALFSDTIRQLESVASANLVPQGTVDVLSGAYRKYRARAHHLSLAGAAAVVPEAEFRDARAAVIRIWNDTMHSRTP